MFKDVMSDNINVERAAMWTDLRTQSRVCCAVFCQAKNFATKYIKKYVDNMRRIDRFVSCAQETELNLQNKFIIFQISLLSGR
jgi:hypothetical protein